MIRTPLWGVKVHVFQPKSIQEQDMKEDSGSFTIFKNSIKGRHPAAIQSSITHSTAVSVRNSIFWITDSRINFK